MLLLNDNILKIQLSQSRWSSETTFLHWSRWNLAVRSSMQKLSLWSTQYVAAAEWNIDSCTTSCAIPTVCLVGNLVAVMKAKADNLFKMCGAL